MPSTSSSWDRRISQAPTITDTTVSRNDHFQHSRAPTITDVESEASVEKDHCSQSNFKDADEKNESPEKSWLVEFEGPDDPENPKNFSKITKVLIVILTSACTFCVSFASSIFSTCTEVTAAEFRVSEEVMILGVSLYVLGLGFGNYHLIPSIKKNIADKTNRTTGMGTPLRTLRKTTPFNHRYLRLRDLSNSPRCRPKS